ncbi:MAG: hypothetical protein ACW986_08585 [Promethearchaeota archaeon]|jgi:hypothetical protein
MSFIRDIQVGVIFSTLITFFFYIALIHFFVGFFAFADIYFAVGSIIGVLYVSKSLKAGKATLKYGIATGVIGSFLSSFFISLYEWAVFSINSGWQVSVFFSVLLYVMVSGIIIGLLAGALTSAYFMYKDAKLEGKDEEFIGDDLFKDLTKA